MTYVLLRSMAFPDTPNKLEAVFVQRNASNVRYDQINISGSDLIVYLDSDGKINADKVPVWAAVYDIPSSGSGFVNSCLRITSNYILTQADFTVLMSGSSLTASLPNAPDNNGRVYNIKNIANSTLKIVGSQSIDNSSSVNLSTQYSSLTVQSNGVQWWII